jgi:spore maturation protein SpmB
MNKNIPRKVLTIIVAYIMATYVEALVFRIYLYVNGFASLSWLFNAQGIKSLILSPIGFPCELLPLFFVKSLDGVAAVARFLCAPLVTFVGAFIGFYLIFNNMYRTSLTGETKLGD